MSSVGRWEICNLPTNPQNPDFCGSVGTPIGITTTCCADLARGVFQRAARDLTGRCLGGESEKPDNVRAEALAWVREAGEGFRFWSAAAGVDWRLVREQLLARVGDCPPRRPACDKLEL